MTWLAVFIVKAAKRRKISILHLRYKLHNYPNNYSNCLYFMPLYTLLLCISHPAQLPKLGPLSAGWPPSCPATVTLLPHGKQRDPKSKAATFKTHLGH
jgi:hypothetical protein